MIGPWVGGALAGVIYRFGVEVRSKNVLRSKRSFFQRRFFLTSVNM